MREHDEIKKHTGSWEALDLEGMEPEFITAVEGDGKQIGISQLPLDMQELIFSKLSLQSISCSRMVCKEWNSILSDSFLSSLPTQKPWLLIYGQDHEDGNWYCMAYCFSTQKWRTISLAFLPNSVRYSILPSAAQGLLLFLKTSQLCVCNPLMKIYTEIEVDVTDKFIHIVQVGNAEPYLVVFSNSKNFSFQIYHYFQDSWRIKSQFAGERGSNILGYEMVECNGVLFWMRERPMTIAGYNIRDGFIKPVTIAPLPRELVEDENANVLSAVAYGSSVLVVAAIKDPSKPVHVTSLNENPVVPIAVNPFFVLRLWHFSRYNMPLFTPYNLRNAVGIVIWELFQDDEDKLVWKWKEFARMPGDSLPEYLDAEWWPRNCVCVGDYLCFSSLLGSEGVNVFAYNLREGFWQRLPPCKYQSINRRMMSFEPNFILYQLLRKLRE